MRSPIAALASLVAIAMFAPRAPAGTVHLEPIKDNTLYETIDGSLSNGAGDHFFAGSTGGGATHRGLVAFDIAGNIPPGSTIGAVTLTLHMSRSSNPNPQSIGLHRVLADWGEGTSQAPGNEGGGGASTAGDATWLHTFFNTMLWTNLGGDFSPGASGSQTVGDTAFYTWTDAAMMADVQGWLDDLASNFGWVLLGNEVANGTSKRFDSRSHSVTSARPVLEVSFTPAVPAAPPWAPVVLLLLLAGAGVATLRRRATV